jgi:hypothetical protein
MKYLLAKKKQEFREITPKNFKRYARYLCDGVEYKDIEEIPWMGRRECYYRRTARQVRRAQTVDG